MKLQIQEPQQNTKVERWWTEARKRVRKSDRRHLDTLIILTAWTLWKQRNARVLGNVQRQINTDQIVDKVREESQLWEFARRGGREDQARE
jgi:hypothetical protein